MFKKILICCTLSTIFNTCANADGQGYIGANIGYVNINDWWQASEALTINGGYNFNKYWALEGGVTWVYPVTSDYSSPSASGSYTQNQSFADAAIKGILPLSDIFNVYAKGGLGIAYSSSSMGISSPPTSNDWGGSSSGTSLGVYMALGGELILSPRVDLVFEDYGLMPVVGNSWSNINVFGVGAKYKF